MIKTAEQIAKELRRRDAYRIENVITILGRGTWTEGKVKLGRAAGSLGRNSYATRPVERAIHLGLVTFTPGKMRHMYNYSLSGKGREVFALL